MLKRKPTFPYLHKHNGRDGMVYECLGGKYYSTYFKFAHKKYRNTRATWQKAVEFLHKEFQTLDTDRFNSESQFQLSRDRKHYSELEQYLEKEAGKYSLREAVDFFILHHKKQTFKPMTVSDCTQRFIQHKKQNGVSLAHIETLEKHFRRFNKKFGTRKIHDIATLEITEWLNECADPKTKKKWSAKTRNTITGSLVGLSLFAMEKLKAIPETLGKTEFQRVDRPRPDEREKVEIYTPKELQKLLDTASAHDPDLIPIIVLGAFQGVRPAEAHGEGVNRKKLQWDAFIWEKKILEVRGQKVRSKKSRHIPIQPATEKWLQPFRHLKGDIWRYSEANTKKLISLRKKAGVKSIKNGYRHSYASYRINQLDQKLPQLAQEMGNSPHEIIDSYKANVTEDETAAWFSVFPPVDYEDILESAGFKLHKPTQD